MFGEVLKSFGTQRFIYVDSVLRLSMDTIVACRTCNARRSFETAARAHISGWSQISQMGAWREDDAVVFKAYCPACDEQKS